MTEHAGAALPRRTEVLVVGAGLAGLAAGVAAARRGREVVMLEASDDVGGRVRTDAVDGYLIDRGFQVLATAYPEVRRLVDIGELDLRPFASGVGIYGGGRVHRFVDPRQDPAALLESIKAPIGTWSDRLRMVGYLGELLASSGDDLQQRPDRPAWEAFHEAGLSSRVVDRALRPFLRGVVLEDRLDTSRRFVDLALRSMLQAPVAVPARGMQQLPRVLARLLPPGALHLGVEVREVAPGRVLTDAGSIQADAIVVATDPTRAAALLPGLTAPPMRPVTTVFHSAPSSARSSSLLLVDGERSLIANSVVLSAAASTYAPADRRLIATSILQADLDTATERAVRHRLADLHGESTAGWETLAIRSIPQALPAMPAPHDFRQAPIIGAGIAVAGDHRDSGSIQGALVSGRRAIEALLDR
jgi:protoporphyrinogen oxidase